MELLKEKQHFRKILWNSFWGILQAFLRLTTAFITLIILTLLPPVYGAEVAADLSVKPSRCIALHEGQQCYQKLQIFWKTDVADDYCLYQQDINEPLTCWQGMRVGSGVYDFVNKSSVKFLLIRTRDGQSVAEFMMEVAWVYDMQSQRKSHWRIF